MAISPDTQIRFPSQQLYPKLYKQNLPGPRPGETLVHWEVGADFQKVPIGEPVDVIYEHLSPGLHLLTKSGSTTLTFDVEAETVELTNWLLMPRNTAYRSFELIRHPIGKPAAAEKVKVVTEYLADDSTILAFKLLSLKAGYTYEITWLYR